MAFDHVESVKLRFRRLIHFPTKLGTTTLTSGHGRVEKENALTFWRYAGVQEATDT